MAADRNFSLPLAAMRAWWRMSRGMTLGARVLARDDAGRVLLVRHTYSRGLNLPGGGVEHGQTVLDAALAELADEAGIDAAPDALTLFGIYLNRNFRGDHVALFTTRVRLPARAPNPREISEIMWADPAALPADALRSTRARIAEVCAGAPVSPYWD